jgi:GntR family transcriptional regulator / MocR family aminotransferase
MCATRWRLLLAPALRLGWMALPERLADEIARLKRLEDMGSPALDQFAFADFLERGELDRHLRRMRLHYRRRRDVLMTALRARLPQLRVSGVAAGLISCWNSLQTRTSKQSLQRLPNHRSG